MNTPPAAVPGVAPVGYHPYAVMLSNHDAEWSRAEWSRDAAAQADWESSFRETTRKFDDVCRNFRKGIEDNHQLWREANGAPEGSPMGPEFYNPVHYWPIDQSDILSITLVDDFDALNHVTAQLPTALENTSIGFCPRLPGSGGEGLFGNLGEILAREGAGEGDVSPLLILSKFKMDGLAVLGLGMAFQAALWSTLAARAEKTRRLLGEKTPALDAEGVLAFSAGDIARTRCALVDLQGCEEIGLFTWTTNLSAAFALIAALGELTYGDVMAADPAVAELMDRSAMHRKLAGGEIPPRERFADNHVFKWVQSQVCVRMNLAQRDKCLLPTGGLTGNVWATSCMQVVPGHFLRSSDHVIAKEDMEAPRETLPPRIDAEFRCYAIGPYDRLLEHGAAGVREDIRRPQPLAQVVTNLSNLLTNLFKPQKPPGRDVAECETMLVVPVPLIHDPTRTAPTGLLGERHFTPLLDVLPRIVTNIFHPGQNAEGPRSLDIQKLFEALRGLGVPVSLRRSLRYLYNDFAILTRDPYSFDIAIDLYDAFASLHNAITRHLRNADSLPCCSSTGREPRRLLDAERVNSLSAFAEALQNAMLHRTVNAFRGHAWRDLAADFRGGLNQILIAADAPLKCGMGVLRHYVSKSASIRSRDTVGCVMRIGMTPGARTRKIRLGIEDKVRLAYFDVDVPHALHIASYCDYLHEAFHLVYEELIQSPDFLKELKDAEAAPGDYRFEAVRLEEIFALLTTRIFIYGDDEKSFLYHTVLTFSREIASVGPNDSETCQRFSDTLVRLFIATDCARPFAGKEPHLWDKTLAPQPDDDYASALNRFESFVKKVGPFFSEYHRLWEGEVSEAIWTYTRSHFEVIYNRTRGFLPVLWGRSLSIYQKALEEVLPSLDPDQRTKQLTLLDKQVHAALEQGSLLKWSAIPCGANMPEKGLAARNLQGKVWDPLFFVCRMLKVYVGRIKEAEGHEVHLRRSATGDLSFVGKDKWWKYQADKGATALFCCIPADRQGRLKRQIVMLKAFWDVSAELRGRRFLEMLLCSVR